MNNKIVKFPAPKKKHDLKSPEIMKRLKEIIELSQSKGIIMMSVNDKCELDITRAGNSTELESILMCSYGTHKFMKEYFDN